MDKTLEQLLEARETFQHRPRSTHEMSAFDAGVIAALDGTELATDYRDATEE